MTETERMYAYFICSIPMIGGVRAGQLLSRFGDPQGVYEAGTAGWREILSDSVVEYMDRQKKSGNLEEEYHSLGEKQIGLVLQEEEGFPRKLLEIPDPPYGLFYKGKLPEQKQPSVAVIGARECSEYGRFVAEELGRYLGSQGIQVISGMARGIDGISQQAALLAGGTSYGVLGCGVDICYPRQNRKLYEELIQKGGLLSTYAPGTKALPAYFPPRNRIVSGLADALIVIEARQKSGTLITVDMALEQGKDVYVVPGRITDRLSDGCNRLLTQGAGVFLSPESFTEEFMRNWEEKQELSDMLDGLALDGEDKPFECVGTKDEVRLSLEMAWERRKSDPPALLKRWRSLFPEYAPVSLENYFDRDNFVPEEFKYLLGEMQ